MVRLDIRQDARPELDAIADGERIGVRGTLFRTRQHMQPSQDDLASAASVPVRKLEGALREGQVDGNPNKLRHGPKGWPAVQQVFVPISYVPVFGSRRGKASESEGGSEHVFAEAGVRVFRIEGIDQKGEAWLERSRGCSGIEERRAGHLRRKPKGTSGLEKGCGRSAHEIKFILQSTLCQWQRKLERRGI